MFIVLFLLFSPSSSFASSRQEIIDNALTNAELTYPANPGSSSDTGIGEGENPKIITESSETSYSSNTSAYTHISDKRKEAIENALYIAAGYDRNHIHYSEWNGQDKIDEDFGSQNGFYINLGYKSGRYIEMFKGRPFIEGYYRRDSGIIKYKGAAFDIFGDTFPFNMMQHSVIQRFGAKIGTHMEFSKAGEALIYVDVGKRIWERGENRIVDGVTDYKEIYHWIYYGLGLGASYRIFPKFSLGIDAEGLITSSPKMESQLDEGGTFRLKNVWGAEVKLPMKYYLLENLTLDFTPYYTFWRINQSDPVVISGVAYVEPDSNTHEEGLMTGLTYTF